MRYQPRHRAAIRRSQSAVGLAAAGLLAGAAVMLMSGSANADSTASGTLNFAGNCGVATLALAKSVPSQTSISVTSASTVTVANDLPCGAHIYVNGAKGAAVSEGGKYTFKAATGATTLQMVPNGLELLSSFKPATVTGKKAAASPSPTNGGSSGTGSGSSGSGSTGSGSSGSGNQGSSGSSGDQHSAGSGTAGSAPTNQPAPGQSPSVNVHQPVARGAVPSSAAAPGAGSGTSGGGGETNGTSGTASTGGKDPAPVPRAVSDTGPSGATSVLALIAAVCLVGVGAVAVRTVLSQRRQFRAQHT